MGIINIGILAHVDAGKTTLTEALLHTSGAVVQPGRVDHGNTTADYLSVEKQRGITVRASTVSYELSGVKVNILDTPGHMDFIAEVERSLSALDAAILVISAREGVQAQTRVLWQALVSMHIPTLFFINKLDRPGADVTRTLKQMRVQLSPAILKRQRIDGTQVTTLPLNQCENINELLFDADADYASAYLAGTHITHEMMHKAYLRGIKCRTLFPAYAGVALSEIGVPELQNAIATDFPRAVASSDDLSALVYKLEFHERLGAIVYARIFGGSIAAREIVNVYGTELSSFRVTQLFTPQSGRLRGAGCVPCGDIAVLFAREHLRVGSVIGDTPPPIKLASIARPMLLVRVSAPGDTPRDKLLTALTELTWEDPLLEFAINSRTDALELRVFGPVQMEILAQLAKERYGIEDLTFTPPQTIFKEQPANAAIGEAPWRCAGLAAEVTLNIRPMDDEEIVYETVISYGYLTTPFQNAVREGVLSMLHNGLYGWEVVGIHITLVDAVFDSVNSTPSDFRRTAPIALIRALNAAGVTLLEPMLAYSLTVPADKAGRATYDVGVMRGSIDDMQTDADSLTLSGVVPLNTSKDYSREVATYTKGLGAFAVRAAGSAVYTGDPLKAVNVGHQMPTVEKYLLSLNKIV